MISQEFCRLFPGFGLRRRSNSGGGYKKPSPKLSFKINPALAGWIYCDPLKKKRMSIVILLNRIKNFPNLLRGHIFPRRQLALCRI